MREPSSPAHREAYFGAAAPTPTGTGVEQGDALAQVRAGIRQRVTALGPPTSPPPSATPRVRVRVEGVTVESLQRKKAAAGVVSKLVGTTTALTAEERRILSGYRLSLGGEVAEQERRRLHAQLDRGITLGDHLSGLARDLRRQRTRPKGSR